MNWPSISWTDIKAIGIKAATIVTTPYIGIKINSAVQNLTTTKVVKAAPPPPATVFWMGKTYLATDSVYLTLKADYEYEVSIRPKIQWGGPIQYKMSSKGKDILKGYEGLGYVADQATADSITITLDNGTTFHPSVRKAIDNTTLTYAKYVDAVTAVNVGNEHPIPILDEDNYNKPTDAAGNVLFYPSVDRDNFAIGFGSNFWTKDRRVKWFDSPLNRAECEWLFHDACKRMAFDLSGRLPPNLTQDEFDALLILAFNLGCQGTQDRLSPYLYAVKTKGSPVNILTDKWKLISSNQGAYTAGLTDRRTREANLFVTGSFTV